MIRKVTLDELHQFAREADSHTFTRCDSGGTYDAVVWYGDKAFHIGCLRSDPTAHGEIEKISEKRAIALTSRSLG